MDKVPVVAFRAVVANPLTTEADLAAVLDDQRALAQAENGTRMNRWIGRIDTEIDPCQSV